jgi:UDP-N-acetylmuramoylalanine--D-glutamate ligase
VGLARSGQAALRVLGPDARGVDRKQGDDTPAALEGIRCVVKSPGVPRSAPVIAAARERGIAVIGELELAWRLLPNEFVAVTGTNGKTTTVGLLGAIHREAGVPAAVAGNVGTALASLVGEIDAGAVVICEASSFQLEDTLEFAPEGAVLLNVAPDHLDRHGTFEDYLAAKLQVFARQGNDDVAVAPVNFIPTHPVEDLGGCARRVCFGAGGELDDRAGHLWWDDRPLIAHEEIRLRGAHNRANAAAAAAIALARGIDREAVRAALRSFAGVEHRLEEVATIDGVLYVNDSKATNVASAVAGLESFAGGVHVILGGRGKGGDYAPLTAPVAERARAVYLIGESGPEIGAALDSTAVPLHASGDLEAALAAARAAARPGEVVLLSPAAASFDQYADFEARGEHFRALVEGAAAVRRTHA